jgi:predicted trehalose synthase
MIDAYRDLNGCVGDPGGMTTRQYLDACGLIAELDDLLTRIGGHVASLRATLADYDMRLSFDDFSDEDAAEVRRLVERLEPIHKALEDIE